MPNSKEKCYFLEECQIQRKNVENTVVPNSKEKCYFLDECQIQRKYVENEYNILNNNELNIIVPNSKENVKNQKSAKLHSIVYSSFCDVDEEKKNEETNNIKDKEKEFIKNDSEIPQKKKRSKQEELNELKRSLTLDGITKDYLGIHNYTKGIDVRMTSINNQDSFESMFI